MKSICIWQVSNRVSQTWWSIIRWSISNNRSKRNIWVIRSRNRRPKNISSNHKRCNNKNSNRCNGTLRCSNNNRTSWSHNRFSNLNGINHRLNRVNSNSIKVNRTSRSFNIVNRLRNSLNTLSLFNSHYNSSDHKLGPIEWIFSAPAKTKRVTRKSKITSLVEKFTS